MTESIPTTPVAGWNDSHPWLVAGTTRCDTRAGTPDFGLFTQAPAAEVLGNWGRLAREMGVRTIVCSRQVHGSCVRVHRDSPAGLVLSGDGDGHASRVSGLLMAVTLADCVPIFVTAPGRRVVAVLHAGWRGAAAGILESGLDTLESAFSVAVDELLVHLGPAICGRCYEVGPEVFEALGEPPPSGAGLLDLRDSIRRRAERLGVRPERLSVSSECTRCGPGYFSHRGGDRGRHVAYVGIRQTGRGPDG